jgi:hypothetical protein
MKKADLTGKRFGKLTAISSIYDAEKKLTLWKCQCDCGNIAYVRANRLVHGRTKSCGCLRVVSNKSHKTTHGMSRTRLYNAWHSMKARCNNPDNHNYKLYGGRGISICEDWLESFESFMNWAVSSGYKEGLSLDRIDNNGNYCPENCRWVTVREQNNNRGVSINISYNGKTQNLSEWCKELGLPYMRIWQRITKYGYSFEEAIKEPSHNRSGKRKKEE